MEDVANNNLAHSVAFRVTEIEWLELQRFAERQGLTVPQLAKAFLFNKAGIQARLKGRRSYGQVVARVSGSTKSLQKF